MEDIFESAVRSAGDIAGVFEFDGETSYFYLWQTDTANKKHILGAIHICSEAPNFESSDIAIKWDRDEEKVGLFIKDSLWAVFGDAGQKFGGNYNSEREPNIPELIRASFRA